MPKRSRQRASPRDQEFVTKEFVTRIRDQTGLVLWKNGDREASIPACRGRPAFPEEVTANETLPRNAGQVLVRYWCEGRCFGWTNRPTSMRLGCLMLSGLRAGITATSRTQL